MSIASGDGEPPGQLTTATPVQVSPATRCLNCGSPLCEPRPRFCSHCGQETHVRAPRFLEFIQQFGGAYLSTEGALWRTFGLLLFRPGELTRRYLAGRRKHYVLPVRLYLTISLATLLLMRLTLSPEMKVGTDIVFDPAGKPTVAVLDLGNGSRTGLADGKFYCERLPTWLCTRLEYRLDLDPKTFQREINRLPERFISHWGTAMFLMVPLFALLQWLVYVGRGQHYTEHLVYALHVHSFWFAALALGLGMTLAGWKPVAGTMAALVPVYTILAARRVYGGGWVGTLLRALLLAMLYGIALAVALGLVGIWAFLS